jgi:hypothetical protein
VILAGALAGPASSRSARHAVDPACQDAWKVDPGPSGVDVVILEPSSVAVGSNCPRGAVRLRAIKSGTKLTAQLRRCRGVRGPARFTATLQPGCDTLSGSIRLRRGGAAHLDAHRHWCGDGTIDADQHEMCEGSNLGDKTCASLPGFIGGELGCTDKCVFDTSHCMPVPVPHCGDGILDPGEQCDGTVQGVTCESLQYAGGTIGCTADCRFDLTHCVVSTPAACGNGRRDPGEACDGGRPRRRGLSARRHAALPGELPRARHERLFHLRGRPARPRRGLRRCRPRGRHLPVARWRRRPARL